MFEIERTRKEKKLTYERISQLMGVRPVDNIQLTETEKLNKHDILNYKIQRENIQCNGRTLPLVIFLNDKGYLTPGELDKIADVAIRSYSLAGDRVAAIYSTILKAIVSDDC